MAEAAISFALEQIFQLLKEKGALLKGVHKEFADIKDELEIILAFLKDADRKASDEGSSKDGIKTWVKQLRELSFRIEDVIAEYNIYVAQGTHHAGYSAFLQKISHTITTVKPLHRIASEIKDIKESVRALKDRGEMYNCKPSLEHGSRGGKWHDPRMVSLFIEEAEVVGFDSPRKQLVDWLVDGSAARTVISVVGMGGLGKTTLTKNVFDNQKVKGHFDTRAFITVSQTYTVEALLRDVLKQFYTETNEPFPGAINTMNTVSLVAEMRSYLQEKRYVIVFDDVWKVEFWDEIQLATLDNMGSRIVITTRNLEVANYCKKSSLVRVHKLQPLPPSKAWELFCKKAFQFDFNGNCPPELEEMSSEIAKKCEGLPLAIVAIGGLLSTKEKTVFEWKRLCQNLSFELGRNPHLTSLTRILALSYDDLPHYLKSCFLYFGIYPEDYSIRCMRLVRQWIAEGFITNEEETTTLEEVAERYLTELIHRSLVQVEVDYDGKASSCRVHDLLYQMIVGKAKDLCFCRVVLKDDHPSPDVMTARRLAIATDSCDVLGNIGQYSHIRSIYIFEASGRPDELFSKFFVKSKLLKVLDLEATSLNSVPDDLGNIFHLRYLSLRKTKVKCIPKSIGKLLNLETLDLRNTLVQELPSQIYKLKKLRYLLVYFRNRSNTIHGETGVRLNGSIGNLTSLQKLYHVEADHGGLNLITELRKLKQLRKLGLKNVRTEFGNALCDSMQDMSCLESLSVSAITEDETIDLQRISSLHHLRKLHFFGRLDKLPDWVTRLQYLVRLSIHFSKLKDDQLKSLKDLPNLLRLSIAREAYVGESLHFEVGFQKLKRLYLVDLNEVSSIVIENGALPALERLLLMRLPQLKEMPSSFHLLKSLETLYLTDMSHEFNQSIDPDHGPKYWVIKHVQMVSIREKVGPNFRDYNYRTIHHPRDT
ncbi:disease resistance protein RPM1-like [Lotus japonicus]|uniref:disease resistance protein RPM1-like n=1 Tax=Lotus japonicus TaxID=34305 RepID=UPI00258C9296|nr:disease resistance protein RPM1-like [Lotus japonicus]XP_057451328.1 disease resistance protein RPM1-like [Lotus japonicus]XP_057451329.1 disease resistance protein RPM1-like [Lotus japonicus]